jgi:hypothetical protein
MLDHSFRFKQCSFDIRFEQWRKNGPQKAFGIFDVASEKLIACIEANLDLPVSPGQANVSFGIFPLQEESVL